MTISLAPAPAPSPAAFANEAAQAVASQVALDARLGPEAAERLGELLAEAIVPWFHRVAEIERSSVARYLRHAAEAAGSGCRSAALTEAADRMEPHVRRVAAELVSDLSPVIA